MFKRNRTTSLEYLEQFENRLNLVSICFFVYLLSVPFPTQLSREGRNYKKAKVADMELIKHVSLKHLLIAVIICLVPSTPTKGILYLSLFFKGCNRVGSWSQEHEPISV